MLIGVTGASGFIGSHLLAAINLSGHKAISLKNNSGPLDAVVHCAAVHADARVQDMIQVNAFGAAEALWSAKAYKAKTFIYMSTVSVNGEISSDVVDATTPIINPSPYGISKYMGELAIKDWPIRAMTIRSCGVIGKGAHRNWLSRVLKSAQLGEEIAISNSETQFNNAVHVSDLCQFIISAIENPDWDGQETVTIGADGMTTIGGIVGSIIDATGRKSGLLVQAKKSRPFVVSSEKAKTFGYRPMHINEMVRRFVAESA